MRIAIISDIHANYAALRAVLKDALRQKVTSYWMLGDAVGYGYAPSRSIEELCKLNLEVWLAGNHDWGLVSLAYPGNGIAMSDQWGVARDVIQIHFEWMREQEATTGYIAQLRDLPYHAQPRPNIFLAHGAYYPDDPQKGMLTRYSNSIAFLEEDYGQENHNRWHPLIEAGQAVIVIHGHNHRPALWHRPGNIQPQPGSASEFWQIESLPFEEQFKIITPGIYHLNPGSVGFPRDDRYPCPTYCILEEQGDGHYSVQFRLVKYESEIARQEMKDAGIPKSVYDDRLLKCR